MELVSIPYKYVVVSSAVSMWMAMVLGVSAGIYWHKEEVPNFLPTVSAAVGDKPFPKFIWQLITCLHAPQRFLDAILYYRFFGGLLRQHASLVSLQRQRFGRALNGLAAVSHICEDSALLTLTLVSSYDHYEVHKYAFIIFVVAAFLHMLLTIALHIESNRRPFSKKASCSLCWRVICFLVKSVFFAISVYLIHRHNQWCEPYMYSYYAACEYVVITANILYHSVAIIDFKDMTLTIGGLKRSV